jgi:hypothetical protein
MLILISPAVYSVKRNSNTTSDVPLILTTVLSILVTAWLFGTLFGAKPRLAVTRRQTADGRMICKALLMFRRAELVARRYLIRRWPYGLRCFRPGEPGTGVTAVR